MKDLVLVRNQGKYSGKYVAMRSFKNKKVIASGTDPLRVYGRAKKLGAKEPVILYVPQKDEVLIY
jgi:hypothetical protein